MRRLIKLLAVLLSAQLVVVGVAFLLQKNASNEMPTHELLSFPINDMDQLLLSSKDGRLKLTKQGEQWVISDYFDFPVSSVKLDQFLQQLVNVKLSWPVATTGSALKRFKVASDEFERKIEFFKGQNTLQTLYLGTTPSFKKVHARFNNDPNIYAIPFSSYEASIKAEDWMDHALLYVSENQMQEVTLPSLEIIKHDDKFTLKDLPSGSQIDEAKLKSLLFKISHLTFQGVLGKSAPTEINVERPVLKLHVGMDGEHSIDYQFYQPKEGDYYVLKATEYDYYFKLPKNFVDELKEIQLNYLLVTDNVDGESNLQVFNES